MREFKQQEGLERLGRQVGRVLSRRHYRLPERPETHGFQEFPLPPASNLVRRRKGISIKAEDHPQLSPSGKFCRQQAYCRRLSEARSSAFRSAFFACWDVLSVDFFKAL